MKKQLILIGIAVILIVVGLSGCFENNNEKKNIVNDDTSKFIGTWRYLQDNSTESLWTFYDNGSVKIVVTYLYEDLPKNDTIWENFTVENNKLCLIFSDSPDCLVYKFFNNYNSVNLSSTEMTVTFNKT
jgi:hypothetical protein